MSRRKILRGERKGEKAIKRSVSKSDCGEEGKLRLVCNFMVHIITLALCFDD